MVMALIEIIWGGSLLAIIMMGCLYVVSPTARRRLMRDGKRHDGSATTDKHRIAER